MDQQRYMPRHSRPFGAGALFDYAAAMTTLFAGNFESRHASSGRRKPAPAPQPEKRAERRWDWEDGSTQTRERRRLVRL